MDKDTCTYAAWNGHLEVLQWAHAQGCPVDEDTCTDAAKHGHLDVLKWLWAHGCRWDEWTCAQAALNGHLDVLLWARAPGCPAFSPNSNHFWGPYNFGDGGHPPPPPPKMITGPNWSKMQLSQIFLDRWAAFSGPTA